MSRRAARRGGRALVTLAVSGVVGGCAGLPPAVLAPAAPPDRIVATVYLIGDAGVPAPADPVLAALQAAVAEAPARATVVFLGDNIYPAGLPDTGDAGRSAAETRLRAQLGASARAARVVFVPGNHDWARHGDDGWNAVRRQQAFIAASAPNAHVLPADGCPGPAMFRAGAVQLIALDTQWWLHDGPKPGPGSGCRAGTPGEVTARLREDLRADTTALTVVVGHHPLRTAGPHGGMFTWKDHLFPLTAWKSWLWLPLPILGSAYPLARNLGISEQDLGSRTYRTMRDSLAAAFRSRPPLVYAAGHEHNLQVLDGGDLGVPTLVVSGAGAYGHTSTTGRLPATRYARRASGFARLDVVDDGGVRLGIIVVERGQPAREEHSVWLVGSRGP